MSSRRSRREPLGQSARRPPRRTSYQPISGPRPDRVAAWAVALGIFLILVAGATSRGATGGAKLATPGTQIALGKRNLSEGAEGPDVRLLQAILKAKGHGPDVVTGRFDAATAAAVRHFQQRALLAVDGIVGPETWKVIVRSMAVRTATWYGPGFYGRRTACGAVLRRSTEGIAHKRLPCGTRVTVYANGRATTVPVIDRGPYARGVALDLTAATARRLDVSRTSRVRLAY